MFNALTMERPYKPAYSVEESLEIMAKMCAGGKWNPDIFEQFKAFLDGYLG